MIRLSLNKSLSLFLLGEESVLFSTKSHQLYGLDRTATVVLLRLEQGESVADVSLDLGLSPESNLRTIELADLLAGLEDLPGEYPNDFSCPQELLSSPAGLPCYRLLTTCFVVEAPSEIFHTWITPYIATLRIDTAQKVNLLVSIKEKIGGWQLLMNGVAQGDVMSAECLLPVLYCRLRIFAYQKQQYLFAIHGTVITDNSGQALILAGCSGSGKSTLAAALLARGFTLVSDEPVVIDAKGKNILSMPLGLGLKEGSWAVLLADYPCLDSLLQHERFDGQKIRYLLSDDIKIAAAESSYPAATIIFPYYSRGACGKLEKLSVVEALNCILTAGYQVPDLDEERVVAIINWLTGIEIYSLTYSSTEAAMVLLKGIAL